MRKILSIALAAAMVMGGCAFAAGTPTDWTEGQEATTKTFKLSYEQSETWTVQIPTGEETVSTFDQNVEIGDVAVTAKKIADTKQITVKVSSANTEGTNFRLKTQTGDHYAVYTLEYGTKNTWGSAITGGAAFLTCGGDDEVLDTTNIAYNVPADNLKHAGTWEDTLTFTVEYGNITG